MNEVQRLAPELVPDWPSFWTVGQVFRLSEKLHAGLLTPAEVLELADTDRGCGPVVHCMVCNAVMTEVNTVDPFVVDVCEDCIMGE